MFSENLIHLRKARRLTQAEHVICVISGSFTQRGMPALFAPHQRAQMALDAGADLVLQMPYSFSVCNAERFALGGVYILKQLGVEALCFGVEQDSIPIIENAAALLESPSDIFKKQLRQALDAGDSFPKAQGQALSQSLHADPACGYPLPQQKDRENGADRLRDLHRGLEGRDHGEIDRGEEKRQRDEQDDRGHDVRSLAFHHSSTSLLRKNLEIVFPSRMQNRAKIRATAWP